MVDGSLYGVGFGFSKQPPFAVRAASGSHPSIAERAIRTALRRDDIGAVEQPR